MTCLYVENDREIWTENMNVVFESLRAYQARIGYLSILAFSFSDVSRSVANQASCFALAFLGRDPQRPGVPNQGRS